MNYKLSELIDVNELQRVMENFSNATKVVTALLEMDGTVLIATGWQDICTKFHRKHPETSQRCTESDTALAGQLNKGEKYNVYRCLNGLADVAVPIIIEGEHVGNFFTGQFFFEPPDVGFFRKQAAQYGFDEVAYLKALEKVPIFSEQYVLETINFLVGLTTLIAKMGLINKRQSDFEKLKTEMRVAKKIQTALLPNSPEIRGYEIAASCKPLKHVGGDYYDVISVKGYDWIVIGDVSGHSVTAGLVMMMVQTAIHTVINENPEVRPSHLLSVINRTIYNNIMQIDETKHMTIIVLAAGKEGQFSFSGLHEPILIRRATTGKVEVIESDGMWIGLEPDISRYLSDNTLKLEKGDCIVLFTDGLPEALCKKDEILGNKLLVEMIEEAGEKSAMKLHEIVMNKLKDSEITDDVTLVVIKRK